MTNQSFDNEVKQKMSEHEMPVPPGVWESIAGKKRKRRFFVFWWATGVGISLLGIIVGRAIINNNSGKETDAVTVNAEQKKIADDDTRVLNDKGVNNDNNDPQNSTGIDVTTIKAAVNENKEEQSNMKRPGDNTVLLNQLNPSIDNESNSSIQIAPGTIGKKKKQQTAGNNNDLNDEIINRTIIPNQPRNSESSDLTQSISYSATTSKRITGRAGLINNNRENKMTIGNFIKQPAYPDSALANDIRESASTLLQPKRSSWMIDVAVNTFMPVRRQQSLTAITRETISPMHKAEFRADKIKTVLHPALSYSVTLRKKVNNRIGIGAGVQYAVIKEIVTLSGKETNTQYSIVQRLENGGSGPQLVNDTVANVTTGTRTIDAVNSYRYFTIPLSLQYMLTDHRDWSLQLNGGIDIGVYSKYNNSINGPLIAEGAAGPISSKQNTSIKTGFFTGLRYSHYLNKNMQWFAEPYLRFNAGRYGNTVVNNKAVHQAGIGVGLSFNIGK